MSVKWDPLSLGLPPNITPFQFAPGFMATPWLWKSPRASPIYSNIFYPPGFHWRIPGSLIPKHLLSKREKTTWEMGAARPGYTRQLQKHSAGRLRSPQISGGLVWGLLYFPASCFILAPSLSRCGTHTALINPRNHLVWLPWGLNGIPEGTWEVLNKSSLNRCLIIGPGPESVLRDRSCDYCCQTWRRIHPAASFNLATPRKGSAADL